MATRVTLSSSRWDINVLLYEEEEAAVRRVLERDSNLRQVDRHRVQRLREVSADGRWFRGVSGQWFHEIQRVNQGYGSASGSSHTSSSASEVKRKGQRITLNDKGEEHRKPAGTRLRTRLTSLLSFRFPQKTKHSKRSHDPGMARRPSETEKGAQLAVPGEVSAVETTHGKATSEEDTTEESKCGEASPADIISVKYSVAEIISGETVAVEFAHEEIVHRKASHQETEVGETVTEEFAHEELTRGEISAGEIILGEVPTAEILSGKALRWEPVATELASGEFAQKERSHGEIIPKETTTLESTYRKALSGETVSQKDSPGETLAGKIINREASYWESIFRGVSYMEIVAKEDTSREVLPGENSCWEIIPGEVVCRKASASEIICGKVTIGQFENEVVALRRPSFGDLIRGEGPQRETAPRETKLGEMTSMKGSPGEIVPSNATCRETVTTNEVPPRDIIPGKSSRGNITNMEIVPGENSLGGVICEEVKHSKTSLGEDSSKGITSEKIMPERINSKEATDGDTTGRSSFPLEFWKNSLEEESQGIPCSSPQEHSVRTTVPGQIPVKHEENHTGTLETNVQWWTSSRREAETESQSFTVPDWLRESIVTDSLRKCGHLLGEPALPGSSRTSTVANSLKGPADLSRESTFSGSASDSTAVGSVRGSIDAKEPAFSGLSRPSAVVDLVRHPTLNDSPTQSRLTSSFKDSTPTHALKGSGFNYSLIQPEDSPQQSFGLFFDTEQTLKFPGDFDRVESSTDLCPLGSNNVELVRSMSIYSQSCSRSQVGSRSFLVLPFQSLERSSLAKTPTSHLLKDSRKGRPVETLRPHLASNSPNSISTESLKPYIFTSSPDNGLVEKLRPGPLTRPTKSVKLHLLTDPFGHTQIQTRGRHTPLRCLSSRAMEENESMKNSIGDNLPNSCKVYKPLGHLSCWNHPTREVPPGSPSHLNDRLMLREKHVDQNHRSAGGRQYRLGIATKKPKQCLGEGTGNPDRKQIQYSHCADLSTSDLHVERTRSVTVNRVHCRRPSRLERMATGPELPATSCPPQRRCQAGTVGKHHRGLSGNQSWTAGCLDGRTKASQPDPMRTDRNPATFRESESDSTTDDEYYLSPPRGGKETRL